MNVLITGCSRHSKGIVDCLKNNEDGRPVFVVGVDYNPKNILREGVDVHYVVPAFTDESYIDTLIGICKKHDIQIILPYITAELQLMASNVDYFSKHGILVSVTPLESLKIANNKIELQKLFGEYMPRQKIAYMAEDVIKFSKDIGYPLSPICTKLSDRCGGAGFAIVDESKANDISLFNRLGVNRYISLSHLIAITKSSDIEIILQEYIGGMDYSVATLCDGKKAVHKCGYVGYSMEYGAVVNGEILYNREAYKLVDEIVEIIGLEGNACFDFILKNDGSVVLLEINPRFNASLPFVAEAGINMPYLRCKQLLGESIDQDHNIQYGLKMNKYYESKYYV